MSVHEQFGENLALYALGTLQGEEASVLEKHLAECSACRRELETLRGDMALLALSSSGPMPPARSRKRLMEAIAREPRKAATGSRRSWWILLPSLATAALVVIATLLWQQNSSLQEKLAGLEQQAARQQAELQRAREIVSTLTATDAMK